MNPLLFFTRSQAAKLGDKIGNEKIIVDFAMRYGNPSIRSRLNKLKKKDVRISLSYLYILSMLRQQQQRFVTRSIGL